LCEYISQQDGWVTSVPGRSPMRIEGTKESSLPAKLTQVGYSPVHVGTTLRTTGSGTDILEISLPQ